MNSSPTVVGGVVYIGSHSGYLYALDAKTGTELWRYETGETGNGSPAIANGIVYAGGTNNYI